MKQILFMIVVMSGTAAYAANQGSLSHSVDYVNRSTDAAQTTYNSSAGRVNELTQKKQQAEITSTERAELSKLKTAYTSTR